MKRRYFIKASGTVILTALVNSKLKAAALANKVIQQSSNFKERIISIVIELKAESTNLVKKIMDGKKYIYDPYTHYPYDGGIKDEQTGYQLFFHAHRKNEYGHFHTFATNEDGELVHLLLISMSEEGKPIGLATVNRWVTGDKYVKAVQLKNFAENWYVDPSLFKDKRVVDFINTVFKSYTDEIKVLFDERDEWIKRYADKYYREPFEDRDHEVLSYKELNLQYS